jgi:hypothetical protein
MANRVSLMREIAELDLQLSKSRGGHLQREQTSMLNKCAEILDSAEEDDEYAICQAIHYLMRKHHLQPTGGWPDALNH